MRRVRPWFMLSRITVRPVTAGMVIEDMDDGLTLRRATRADLVAASDENPDQLSPAFVSDALERGDFCVAAFDGPRMVAWTWASVDTAPHGDGVWVKVQPPYEYGYKSFTNPEYRRRRIIGRISLLRDRIAADIGCTQNVGFIETHNFVSVKSNQRLGSRLVGYAGYFRVFGRVFPFRTPGVVKHTFRFYPRANRMEK